MVSMIQPDPEPPHLSFRSFVHALKEDGDLIEINDAVDPNLEAAAITRLACETRDKAPLFNNLIGAENGFFRMLGAPAGLRKSRADRWGRLGRHLGLPPTASIKEITENLIAAPSMKPIEPTIVGTGPVKENFIVGDDIDLTKIPAPMVHESDGGKYIGTYGMHVFQTPDGKWTNWSIARAMVSGKRTLTGLVIAAQHIWKIREMWKKEKRDVPWAFTFGVPPAAIMVSSMPIPSDVSEAGYVDTNGLYIPANTEVVFEGTLSITDLGTEGPYTEMHGYGFPGEEHEMPVYTVNKITYRDNAIVPLSATGRLTDETHTMVGLLVAASLLSIFREEKLPITNVYSPLMSMASWLVIQVDGPGLRKMNTNSKDFMRRIGDIVFQQKPGWVIGRIILIVYDDVKSFSLLPYMAQGDTDPARGGKIISDALLTSEYTTGPNWVTGDFKHAYPKAIQDKVLTSWDTLGFRQLQN
ncbi:UbiD decarboxylyase family [Trichoderma compactum]